ncbi:hypothetical protein GCM10007391_03840 [Alteromonas halophila]|uniref:Uncharacterized protein n=1 Tax=Alteromonas halophila TaxID=516698 RepID=A0A918JGI0_9ALTE|nr:hypothetical protein GCM10007391_03840 [Alteromonas halophila]
MEEVAGSLGRGLWSVLRWLVLVVLFEIAFYWCGYGIIKLATFGKHPINKQANINLCTAAGFVFTCTLLLLVAYFL